VQEIKVSSNEGPGPFQRGDNNKNANIGLGNFKIFSRTTGPGKLKFTRKLFLTVQ
jgi:hypothetical protein